MSLRGGLLLGAVMLAIGAAPAHADQPVRVAPAAAPSAQDPIWSDPAPPGTPLADRLAARGYLREETFLSGLAGSWRAGPDGAERGSPSTRPYTTRLIVIRPISPERFSGRVHLVPIHPSAGDTPWDWVSEHVLANGDAFVAVMIGGDAPSRALAASGRQAAAPLILKAFNPARYARIDWPDDDSARWEAFGQTATALKADDAILGARAKRVYASGWSFTGSFLRTFINEGFHDLTRLEDGAAAIDGYLIGISAGGFIAGYVPLDSLSPVRPVDDPRRVLRAIDAPVVELMSQNEALTNTGAQPRDSGAVKGGRRLYELGGLTHGDGLRSTPAPQGACPYPASDVSMSHYARATLARLEAWVERGVSPPASLHIARGPDGNFPHDENGNVSGGLRPVELDVPLASYAEARDRPECTPRAGPSGAYLAIRRIPLSKEKLNRLYPGGAADYLAKIHTAVAQRVQAGWLSRRDAEEELSQASAAAARAFR